jgi:hypothetical protein
MEKTFSAGHPATVPDFPILEAQSIKPKIGRHPGYFCWSNYGSSANRATLDELAWIITVIFETTPSQFRAEYITNDKSKIHA